MFVIIGNIGKYSFVTVITLAGDLKIYPNTVVYGTTLCPEVIQVTHPDLPQQIPPWPRSDKTTGNQNQSINQSVCLFVTTKHASTQVQIMTTYEKHLYGVTGSTQGADAPLIRATHVLKTEVECMFSQHIIRTRRSRSAAAYSDQTFPWTICASNCPVNCGKTAYRIRMPFGVIGRTGPGMRQVVGFGIGSWKGVLLGANFGRAIVTNWDFTASLCDSAATRSSSQITFGKLVCLAYRRNRTKRHYEKLNARGRMSSAKQTVQEDLCQFEATCVQSLYVMLAFVLFLRIKP